MQSAGQTTPGAAAKRPPDWKALRTGAAGMLPAAVYEALYDLARDAPDLDIVEIGAASGAGSIALARGLIDAGKRSSVVVAEKLEGGSRADIGDRDANLRVIEENFRTFGVAERIRLFPREVTFDDAAAILGLVRTPNIAALVHDADGRVDRDFLLFWPLLVDGGAIVIDDYENRVEKFRPPSERYPQGGAKGVITFRLTNLLVGWGLIEKRGMLGNTLFGVKPAGADIGRLDRAECERAIAEVFRERDAAIAAKT